MVNIKKGNEETVVILIGWWMAKLTPFEKVCKYMA